MPAPTPPLLTYADPATDAFYTKHPNAQAELMPKQSWVVFGQYPTPGIATIVGLNTPRKWDQPGGYGISGSASIYTGAPPAKFGVEIKLWRPDHFRQWEAFARLVLAKPINRSPVGAAIGIRHPLVNLPPWGISAVVIEDVEGFVQNETGLYTTVIRCLEFREPQPALTRPIAEVPAVEVPIPTAQDAAETEMLGLVAEARGLGG